jgi:spore coat protein A
MLNRRKMIRNSVLGLAGALATPRRLFAQHQQPLSGTSPVLTPFVDALPVPPVLQPVLRGKTRFHTLTMRAGLAKLHRDLPAAVVWGFNGMFPGPTIKAVKGQPVVVRQINQLPEHNGRETGHDEAEMRPAVHLHGAHVHPLDDGHPRESIPPFGFRDYRYPNRQRAATLFYHDHSHGMTGLHVARGLAGTYLIEDPEERFLGLPEGDYDIPLMIQDRVLNADGSFQYGLNADTKEAGVIGDAMLVNGVVQPFLKVARRKYRFRIVNGSSARIYDLQLSSGRPLVQIGTDGGLLPKPAEKTVIALAPSERADVVLDFAAYPMGARVRLRNCANCQDRTGDIMRFDVELPDAGDAALPDCLSSWEDLPVDTQTVTRQFLLNRQTTSGGTVWTVNGRVFEMNGAPLVQVKHGTVERWRFVNPTNHPHPVHIHHVQFQVVELNGHPQDPSKHGWKDTLVAAPGGEIVVAARFEGYTGRYLLHCHNLEHEDLGMMADYEIIP